MGMGMTRLLKSIAKRMKDNTREDGDWEIQHQVADDILIEIIRAFVENYDVYEAEIEEILADCGKVPKWYA